MKLKGWKTLIMSVAAVTYGVLGSLGIEAPANGTTEDQIVLIVVGLVTFGLRYVTDTAIAVKKDS